MAAQWRVTLLALVLAAPCSATGFVSETGSAGACDLASADFSSISGDSYAFTGGAPWETDLNWENYPWFDLASPSVIPDGGEDMYDVGNRLSITLTNGQVSAPLVYTQTTTLSASGQSFDYLTYKRSGPTVFVAEFSSASVEMKTLGISGELGADGSGSKRSWNLGSPAGNGWSCWGQKVHSAGTDPSINQLIMASTSGGGKTTMAGTDYEDWNVTVSKGTDSFAYVLWAGAQRMYSRRPLAPRPS